MPNLHVHFGNGNLKAFRQELDGTGTAAGGSGSNNNGNGGGWKANGVGPGSASGGRSWTMGGWGGNAGPPVKADINERDQFGRTVLHLAAASLTPIAYNFLNIILRNPNVSVNLQDIESGYTALHRALFVGNIRAARDLLARSDIDTSIKDSEGMTAFDLYNGTVDGTNPPQTGNGSDLYVWGVNRNFSLGTGDSNDKAYPDHINLMTQAQASGRADAAQKFDHVGVQDVAMAKLHTGVITTESKGNLSLCGFGSNGRLGRSIHSQLSLLPMPDMPHTITSIALGQDHTLALASGGYVLSWGHNRFSQLGYPIEVTEKPLGTGRDGDDLVQISPKRIVGPLKKEWVRGVAAGRMASACWTADAVWTWGTNAGHLGYDKASNPVQVIPRRVTSITQPVIDIAFSDYAMICLLDTFEVLCFHRDSSFKISFSTPRVLSEAFPFRPPQATLKPSIKKVTSCGTAFAALSSIGDVFTFSLPNPLDDIGKDARGGHVTVKPQIVWALRKSFTAVRDVALGSDGTVIICTHSGHVFVRQRLKSGSGQLKFRRIPYLQRVTKVAVNESGAFAAIRADAKATPIALTGQTLQDDMFLLQPHFRRFDSQMTADRFEESLKRHNANEDEDEDESTNSIAKDMTIALKLCTIVSRWRDDEGDSLFSWSDPLLGSDVHLVIKDVAIPAHSVLLALRVPKFQDLFAGKYKNGLFTLGKYRSSRAIYVKACHPLVGLMLLQYIYSDDIAAIWDARVARVVQEKFASLKLPLADIRANLKTIATELDLEPLVNVLSSAGKQPISRSTLSTDIQAFFASTHTVQPSLATQCDVTIRLEDKDVSANSIILRARCPFFDAMFADEDWTVRRKEDGRVTVDMSHLKWRPMRLVFRFLHEGAENDLFDYLHQETLDAFIDFVFEVLAAATELLLDRLVLVCSQVIIRHCNAFNAAALATEAAFYQATTLKLSIFDYIISCMETMLESGLLDEMDNDVLLDLCNVISQKQAIRLSVTRNQILVKQAMEKHREWLQLQDIPQPRVRQPFKWKPRSPALSPVDTMSFTPKDKDRERAKPSMPASAPISPLLSPDLQPDRSSAADGIFQMDDDLPTPPFTSSGAQTPRANRPMTPLDLSATPGSAGKSAVWKSKKVESEKIDLRSVMAEAAAKKPPLARPPITPNSALASGSGMGSGSGIRPPASSAGFPTLQATPTKGPGPALARSPPSIGQSGGGPWRPMEIDKTSLSSVQASQTTSSLLSTSTPTLSRPAGSQASPVPQRSGSSNLIITPVKLGPPPPGSAQPRKTSGGAAAWSTPTTFAAPQPIIPITPKTQTSATAYSPSAQFSLLAIQQQERDIAELSAKKPAKSLVQIQAEERKAEEDKAQEEEFMRWWAEEEARLAQESGGGNAAGPGSGTGKGAKGRGGKVRVPNTKGRGGGGGGGGGATGTGKFNGSGTDQTQGPPSKGARTSKKGNANATDHANSGEGESRKQKGGKGKSDQQQSAGVQGGGNSDKIGGSIDAEGGGSSVDHGQAQGSGQGRNQQNAGKIGKNAASKNGSQASSSQTQSVQPQTPQPQQQSRPSPHLQSRSQSHHQNQSKVRAQPHSQPQSQPRSFPTFVPRNGDGDGNVPTPPPPPPPPQLQAAAMPFVPRGMGAGAHAGSKVD
ncbi:hypothetical protein I316_01751 [Kwoniella heveanensis BCC8398]|uniref:BTB domain-containing protein n=1 Tax=Kwoniella heveanensis BCC8398 TaxID=1296120 RepID=A0A1B9GZQ3_9TREE|nr:hypothetical protein I316_01751 [Kwoniella heveanensis BCC8398]